MLCLSQIKAFVNISTNISLVSQNIILTISMFLLSFFWSCYLPLHFIVPWHIIILDKINRLSKRAIFICFLLTYKIMQYFYHLPNNISLRFGYCLLFKEDNLLWTCISSLAICLMEYALCIFFLLFSSWNWQCVHKHTIFSTWTHLF